MTTDEEKKLFRRYSYCWFLTFPTLLLFGLYYGMKHFTRGLPELVQKVVLIPFGLATILTNGFYNHTAAVYIFREWPPDGLAFSERMSFYYRHGKFPKLRRHLCRMVQSFDPDHFTHMDDL